jgi:tetratricopeptide (TPR) repeat protein
VSTTRLEVPSKARDDYKRACAELKRKNVAAAEQNVRSAIEKYESYAAAWVMLGEILQARQDPREGQKACAEAQKADPAYLPSYLCLAEAAIQNEDWEEVLKSTRAALDLNPASDPYAYYYRAVAYFRLNGLPEAQTNALEAVRIDRTSRETSSCELLRRIYEAQGNTPPPSPDCKGF